MFNNSEYSLCVEMVGEMTSYYVTFKDSQGIRNKVEVSYSVYVEFHNFKKTERNLKRSDERHIERSELTEEAIYRRALSPSINLDELYCDNLRIEQVKQAIQQLSNTQKRRLILYYFYNLNYEQIAMIEGITKMPIKRSIDRAEEIIRNHVRNY